MKNIFTLFPMNKLILLFAICSFSNQLFASNETVSLNTNNAEFSIIDDEWKVLVETTQISIYYVEVKNNPCMSYKLKIVNHTNTKQTISFGVAAKLADDCKGQYKDLGEFQFRKIEIEANSTIVGDENTKSLLLPTTTSSVKELLQNLSAQ